jgi:phosphatidylglycerophosphate synthase
MLGAKLRKLVGIVLEKVGFIIAKTGVDPNIFSSLAIIWAAITSYFIVNGNMITALIFGVIASIWDSLDGGVARAQNKSSKFGMYIDGMIDKIVEIIIYLGFVLAGFVTESFLVMSGSLFISYAKTRTALVVPIDNHDWPAIGERLDRLILLGVSIGVSIFFPTIMIFGTVFSTLSLSLYLIAAIVFIGAIQRVFYAKKIIDAGGTKNFDVKIRKGD